MLILFCKAEDYRLPFTNIFVVVKGTVHRNGEMDLVGSGIYQKVVCEE
jgi:hypothetical protein